MGEPATVRVADVLRAALDVLSDEDYARLAARIDAMASIAPTKPPRETPDAFRIDKAGRRFCLLCVQAKDRARGPRGSDYWKRINEKRRGKSGRSE